MKILICDDQAVVRDGLELLLKLENDFEVIGTAAEGTEALELIEKRSPELVLMDLKMPGMNGIEATRQIKTNHPEIKVLILTTYNDDEWVFDAVRVGASGYLLKDTPREDLVRAIRGTMEGRSYVDPGVAGKILDRFARKQVKPETTLTRKLTDREVDVLRFLARGLSNPEIAARLHLSEGTVRNHVSAILAKMNISDRTQAAIIAIQHGLG